MTNRRLTLLGINPYLREAAAPVTKVVDGGQGAAAEATISWALEQNAEERENMGNQ